MYVLFRLTTVKRKSTKPVMTMESSPGLRENMRWSFRLTAAKSWMDSLPFPGQQFEQVPLTQPPNK